MADEDMTGNGNGNGNGFDALAQYARLSERVENQGKDIIDLRSNMNTGFQGVNANLATLSNELRSNSRTQWPAIWAALSVGVAILTGLGFMALQPIKENTLRLENAIVRVAETSVPQKEMEWRTQRGSEDRKRSEDALNDIRSSTVSRNEWSERNHARDNQITEISRRIDELRQDVGSQYTTRDVLLSTQSEVKDLRNQLRRLYESSILSGDSDASRDVSP